MILQRRITKNRVVITKISAIRTYAFNFVGPPLEKIFNETEYFHRLAPTPLTASSLSTPPPGG